MGEEWDDSLQSREQIEANLLHKYEAALRRERALAYSYSHQVLDSAFPIACSILLNKRKMDNSTHFCTSIVIYVAKILFYNPFGSLIYHAYLAIMLFLRTMLQF